MRIITISYNDLLPQGYIEVNCTSRGDKYKELSPFTHYDVRFKDIFANNVENAWQFSKVYPQHDDNGTPNEKWYEWRERGFKSSFAYRYPMGKGAKPLYSYVDGVKYDYVSARKEIYFPLYIDFCLHNSVFLELYKEVCDGYECYAIRDFDAYKMKKLTLKEVVNNPYKKVGHGFVLYHLLTNENYK